MCSVQTVTYVSGLDSKAGHVHEQLLKINPNDFNKISVYRVR
jgi:hypothetical protein